MRVFIFEHVAGGGTVGRDLPPQLARQGRAMLEAAIRDFAAAGCDVVTTVDARLSDTFPPVPATIHTVTDRDEPAEVFDRLAAQTDATLPIAPESDRLLEQWCRRLDVARATNLTSAIQALSLCADKLALTDHLRRRNIPTPAGATKADALTPPLIAKPRFGAGCEQTYYLPDHVAAETLACGEHHIYETHVPGQPLSVSLIATTTDCAPVAAARQHIDITAGRLEYTGGKTPLHPDRARSATHLACQACQTVPGLRGFVGVDLVLHPDGDTATLIEINPRLTVSFSPLSRCAPEPLAHAILGRKAPPQLTGPAVSFNAAGELNCPAP